MNRRRYLAASATAIIVGCSGCLETFSSRVSESTADGSGAGENGSRAADDGTEIGLRFIGVYAADADRDFIDGEYIALENAAADPLPVSGYAVEYPGDQQYRIEDLTLEPGAQLALILDRGDDSTLLMSPPCYLRYTEGDAGAAAPELPANGTVRVKDATGSIVTEARYEKFGCDGGTVTTPAGDDVECLHPV